MAFAKSSPIPMEFVVTVFGIQLVPLSQFLDNIIQELEIQAAFFGTLVTFLISGGKFDAIGHSSNAFFKSSMLS